MNARRDVEELDGGVVVAGPDGLSPGKKRPNVPNRPGRVSLMRIGVLRADGSLPMFGSSVFRNRSVGPTEFPAEMPDLTLLPGVSIFGGIVGPQFGHLVTQSIGRLWAAGLSPEAPILFVSTSPEFTALPGYFVDLIRALGVGNPVRMVPSSVRCERLILPEDQCNLARRPCMTPEFRLWLTGQVGPATVDPDLRVYVSRSGLSLLNGQYLQETTLESALVKAGYTIVYPERLSIAEQVDVYRRAQRLIFADGSAAHLWSLFASDAQQAAIIWRRPRDRNLAAWMRTVGSPKPVYFDHGVADLSRRGEGGGRSVALLDLRALWGDLRAHGFHDQAEDIGADRAALDDWAMAVDGRRGALPMPAFPLDQRSQDLLRLRTRAALRKTAEVAGQGESSGQNQGLG